MLLFRQAGKGGVSLAPRRIGGYAAMCAMARISLQTYSRSLPPLKSLPELPPLSVTHAADPRATALAATHLST